GALVAEHGGGVARRIGARGRVEIGVADAAGPQLHKHLALGGRSQLHLLHLERLAELLQHRGAYLHASPPRSGRADIRTGQQTDVVDREIHYGSLDRPRPGWKVYPRPAVSAAGSSISRFTIFPDGPFGSSSKNEMRRGYL